MTNVDEDLAFAPTYELAELIATKQVSPVEVTELYFKRIEELDGRFNAYLTLTQEQAMRDAKTAELAVMNGDSPGPLHGVPISIKDLEMTRGVRTTIGSLIFKDWVPEEDSVVVERVKSSGAVIMGKTNTPEFGFRGSTENRLGEPCRNPWNPERTPGGSSGGAAASVLAGMCSIATGSDGGGSIRIPASFCGIYGIKPTQGRVPRYAGAGAPIVANQLGQSGPLSRTVRDSAILLQILAGHDSRDATSLREAPGNYVAALDRDVGGLRISWSPDFGYAPVDPEVVSIASEAAKVFEELGCIVDDSKLKLDEPGESFRAIFSTNTYAGLGHFLEERGDELTDYVREGMEFGRDVTGANYARALGYRDVLKAQFADVFENYDLILTPTMAVPAFPVGEAPTQIAGRDVEPFIGFLPFTHPINMIGNPAASVPCGFSSDGLPVGLHIIGRFGDEETVLAASAAFERVRPWIQHRPTL